MAILGGKSDLIAENAELRGENKALHSQITFLQEQLRKTQDALIAKESPMAYHDQKNAEVAAQPMSPEQLAEREKMRRQSEFDRRVLEEMESPLFKSAEDMQAMLLPILNRPSESRSVHQNLES